MSYEFLTIIVTLNALATIALWRTAAQRPQRLKKQFFDRLLRSDPITPKHEPPPPLKKDEWWVNEGVMKFFDDFEDFGYVVNWWLADEHVGSHWRVQELPNAELRLGSYDSPTYGRRYAIFCNQIKLGILEVHDFDPCVIAQIKIEFVRLLSFGEIQDFLVAIALHICDPNPDSKEYIDARQTIDRAMIAVCWESGEISDEFDLGGNYGEINLRLVGSAEWYFGRRRALRSKWKDEVSSEGRPIEDKDDGHAA